MLGKRIKEIITGIQKSMIEKIKNSIINTEFKKNVFTLFSGTLFAQLIPVLILPILTRLFSEELFGIYFLYTSITAVLSIVITLQYEQAIVLPKKESDSINIFILTILITFLLSLLLLLIIVFWAENINQLLGNRGLGIWIYFIPLSTFFTGLYQAFNYWNNRNKSFKNIAWSKLFRSAPAGFMQLAIGFSPLKFIGLVPGLIFGQFISVIYYIKKINTNLFSLFSVSVLRKCAQKYLNIPYFNTTISGLNKLSNYLPFFLLNSFYGPETVAFYGIANRVLSTPVGLIGQSIGQVFFQKATDSFNKNKNFSQLVKSTYLKLAKLAALPYLIAIFITPLAFEIVLGEKWTDAGLYAIILIPWLFFMFLNSPVSMIVTILNKQKKLVIYDVFFLIFRFFALYAGFAFHNSVFYSLLYFSATGVIFNTFYLIYMLHISKRFENAESY